jgi:hypothetical protein
MPKKRASKRSAFCTRVRVRVRGRVGVRVRVGAGARVRLRVRARVMARARARARVRAWVGARARVRATATATARANLGQVDGLEHQGHVARPLAHGDHVAHLHAVGRDVHPLAVDGDVAVVDELARGERGRHELGAIDHRVQTAFQQRDEVFRGIALAAGGLVIDAAELLLGDVAVVALQLLLGAQLQAKIRHLGLAALAVLAGAVGALVHRALRATPEVLAHTPVNLVLRRMALRHECLSLCLTRTGLPRIRKAIATAVSASPVMYFRAEDLGSAAERRAYERSKPKSQRRPGRSFYFCVAR